MGRNVAWDYVLERMNCEFKQGLHGVVTRERLHDFATIMNGFKHTDAMIKESWGVETDDVPSQYTHVLDEDVRGIVAELEKLPGKDCAEVRMKASRNNPFGKGPMPWDEVEAKGKHDLAEFVTIHLEGLRTDEA